MKVVVAWSPQHVQTEGLDVETCGQFCVPGRQQIALSQDVFRAEDFLRVGSQFDRQVYALQEDISRTLARMKEFNAEQARGDKKALEDLCSLRGRIFRRTCEVPESAPPRFSFLLSVRAITRMSLFVRRVVESVLQLVGGCCGLRCKRKEGRNKDVQGSPPNLGNTAGTLGNVRLAAPERARLPNVG